MNEQEKGVMHWALMGDRASQDDCTKLGIALPCPCCGSDVIVNEIPPHKHALATFMPDYEGGCFIECPSCNYANCGKTKQEALMNHNRRPAPPIGYCRECRHWTPRQLDGGKTGMCVRYPNGREVSRRTAVGFYCGDFKPKEDADESKA